MGISCFLQATFPNNGWQALIISPAPPEGIGKTQGGKPWGDPQTRTNVVHPADMDQNAGGLVIWVPAMTPVALQGGWGTNGGVDYLILDKGSERIKLGGTPLAVGVYDEGHTAQLGFGSTLYDINSTENSIRGRHVQLPSGAEAFLWAPSVDTLAPSPWAPEPVTSFVSRNTDLQPWQVVNKYFPGSPQGIGHPHSGWRGERQTRVQVVESESLGPNAPRIVLQPKTDTPVSLRIVDKRGHIASSAPDLGETRDPTYINVGPGEKVLVGYGNGYSALVEAGKFDGQFGSVLGRATYGQMHQLFTLDCTTPGRVEIKMDDVQAQKIDAVGILKLPQGLKVFFHDPAKKNSR